MPAHETLKVLELQIGDKREDVIDDIVIREFFKLINQKEGVTFEVFKKRIEERTNYAPIIKLEGKKAMKEVELATKYGKKWAFFLIKDGYVTPERYPTS